MSIALLGQVYDDMLRIAVAGSAVAPGDFRLKKHVAPLEQAGAKAPVFARTAEATKAVVESTEATAPQNLLELASLVNAVLYTQGDTSSPGPLEPIASTELDLSGSAQTTARTLKPLLEALSNTGGGRLELIKDALERGAFKDLRLVKPSLAALDDGYGEIADLIAEKALPHYGRAILPELRAKFDAKGKGGHARRLGLLHALDPAGTRDLVKAALDGGSKEVKIAAIECLGRDPEDLSYLLEQSAAKAQEVRRAAYLALATVDDPAAIAVLKKAMTGKDLDNVAAALVRCRNIKVLQHSIEAIQSHLAAAKAAMEKKAVSKSLNDAQALLATLMSRKESEAEGLLLQLFKERADLVKLKGDTFSGVDLNSRVVAIMATGSSAVMMKLVASHPSLEGDELACCFGAARQVWPAAKVFAEFSPYLRQDAKAVRKDGDKKTAILGALTGRYDRWGFCDMDDEDKLPPLHADWLDAAVAIGDVRTVSEIGRPGHEEQNRFLRKAFDETVKSKTRDDCQPIVAAMVKLQHPDATDCLIAVLEKVDKKAYWASYYYEWMIPDLPASAIPKLEAVIPKLGDRDADRWLDRIQQLRAKHPQP